MYSLSLGLKEDTKREAGIYLEVLLLWNRVESILGTIADHTDDEQKNKRSRKIIEA